MKSYVPLLLYKIWEHPKHIFLTVAQIQFEDWLNIHSMLNYMYLQQHKFTKNNNGSKFLKSYEEL